MTKFIIPIIITVILIAGIGGFFIFQKPAFPEQFKEGIGTLPESVSEAVKQKQSLKSIQDSPFGFLAQYIDNSNTKKIYSAYGGFSAIQKIYKDLGVHWDRGAGRNGGATWGAIEKNIDGYRSMFDNYVKIASNNNINLLITISPAYSEAKGEYYLPTDLNAYAEFIKKLVGDYPSVKYWQIHNEVNGGVFWKDTPQNYAKLVRATSDAIRESCGDCVIVLGSSIKIDEKGNSKSIATYFEPVLKELRKDNKKYFDVFDYHFFAPAGSTPDLFYSVYEDGIKSARNLLDKYGYKNAEIWTTETMIFTTDGMSQKETGKLPSEYQNINEAQQTDALLKIYVSGLANGVSKIFWNKLTEGPWFDFMFNRAGLIKHPNFSGSASKKLSYYTYKKMTETLEGSDWNNIQTIQESDGVYVYKFTKQSKPIWVAWNDNSAGKTITITGIGSQQVNITEAVPKYESGKDVTDYNTAFNTEIKPVSNGKITITLGDKPVFVEE